MSPPHIVKKGRILQIKSLNKDSVHTHWFSTNEVSIKAIQHLGNNLNAVSARTLLGLYKLLSFFGISKDPSHDLSKNPTNWNRFSNLLERGVYTENLAQSEQNQELVILIEKNNSEIQNLSCKIEQLANQEVQLLCHKVDKLEKYLKIILGQN
jgi:hypothetical protein